MKSNNLFLGFVFAILFSTSFVGCKKDPITAPPSGGNSNGGSGGNSSTFDPNAINVMPVGINHPSYCTSGSYVNKPCVEVTICNVDGTSCTTVGDILLDTGSYGLRIFKQAIPGLNLPQSSAGNIAQCMEYGDGSKQWGPIKQARLQLGKMSPITLPVQVIDYEFPGMDENCGGAEKFPGQGSGSDFAGFNGILGVGVFQSDCGNYCASNADNQVYFRCSGNSCQSTAVSTQNQVQNPIGMLASDNNGVVMRLPAISTGGKASEIGYMIFGIGTRPNNQPGTVTRLRADPNYGEVTTVFGGKELRSFIDTGSNAYAIPPTRNLPNCDRELYGWMCPDTVQSLNASMIEFGNGKSKTVAFRVDNFRVLFNSGRAVFSENAFESFSNIEGFFAWGLPFYFGKLVYQGIEGQSSSLGSGEFWAF